MDRHDPSDPEPRFSLPRWSLRHPTVVLLATVLFVVWGLYDYSTMSRREDPEIQIATALVVSVYPGAGAAKVEKQVTTKLEDAIESLDGLEEVESTSRENLSVIHVTVRYDVDTDIAWQNLRSEVESVKSDLPASVIGPDVWDDFGDTTSLIVAIQGASPEKLTDVAEDLKDEIRRVPSVGDIEVIGKIPEVVYVEGHRAQLARYGITPYELGQVLELQNLQVPGGAIRTEDHSYRVEPSGAFGSAEPIANAIVDVSRTTGRPVHVRDLFEVRRTIQDPPTTKLLSRGESVVALGLVMKRGYNIVTMGEEVRQVLAAFEPRLPHGVKMRVVHDSPRHVDELVGDFMTNLVEGVLIVIVVMALFMGLRPATVAAAAIPLSVLVAMSFMPGLQVDLEMVSISAFIVALGMLVDNSIIVADNVDIKLREGLPADEAAWRGTQELIAPIISGTLATAVAFLPMLLLSAETGAYVRSLPLVVTVALLGSLLISLTLTPWMCMVLLRRRKASPAPKDEPSRMAGAYRRMMEAVLRHRGLVVAASVLTLVASAGLFRAAGMSFFPDAHRDQFTIDVWLQEGASLDATEQVARQVEQQIRSDPDVGDTLVHVGKGAPRFYITVKPELQKTNFAQILVNTTSADVTHAVIDRFNREAATRYPGARVFARKLIMGIPVDAPVEIRVVGDDLATLRRIGKDVRGILRGIPGTDHIHDDIGPDVPALGVQVDEERATRVGVSNTDVALAFLSAYEGHELTRFHDGEDEIPVVLRLPGDEREIDEDLASLPVASSITGNKVPLGSIASVEPKWGPGVIKRRNNQRVLTVRAFTRGRLADEIVREAAPEIASLRVPSGYRIEVAGEKEEMDKAFGELLEVFGLIVAGLVAILVIQLGTLRKTAVVLSAIPLSLFGVGIALVTGGFSFSFMAFLGVVSLAGMVIKNAVVWVEFAEQARHRGTPMREAVIESGIRRLRPILLTTVTTVGGLVPLALFGGVLFEPMAWSMIAGLSWATVLTLVAVPVLYSLLVPERASTSLTQPGKPIRGTAH